MLEVGSTVLAMQPLGCLTGCTMLPNDCGILRFKGFHNESRKIPCIFASWSSRRQRHASTGR